MNRIDYFKNRACELKREAADTSDPKLKREMIDASRAFERLAARKVAAASRGRLVQATQEASMRECVNWTPSHVPRDTVAQPLADQTLSPMMPRRHRHAS
jgi:hypothetical protein